MFVFTVHEPSLFPDNFRFLKIDMVMEEPLKKVDLLMYAFAVI